MPDMKVVCEYRAKDVKSPTDFEMERVETAAIQRGVWNKNIITWRINNWTQDFTKERDLRYAFNIGFTEWDIEIPAIFIEAPLGEEADIVIDFRHRVDDPYYPDSPNVLAYAGYPDGALKGIMVFFDDFDWNTHGKSGYNVINVLIHELGHILGFPHTTTQPYREPNMMDPIYNANVNELMRLDVENAVGAYGARQYDNQSQHDRLENANRVQKKRLINEP